MRLHLDEDLSSDHLVNVLRRDGHDVQSAGDVGLLGEQDANHLIRAIQVDRTVLTQDHDDFDTLHRLVRTSGGHHPGILVVRRDNDPTRDMTPRGIARAIVKLLGSEMRLADGFHVLNHWR